MSNDVRGVHCSKAKGRLSSCSVVGSYIVVLLPRLPRAPLVPAHRWSPRTAGPRAPLGSAHRWAPRTAG